MDGTNTAGRLLLRRILITGALFLLTVLLPAGAEAGWGVEITPYAGFTPP